MNDFTSSNHMLLRTQVYDYLREQLKNESFLPGMVISINKLIKDIDIGRTPLRDALLQLQSEGFVSFLPGRGIKINKLSLQEIESIYEILGALDSRVFISIFDKIGKKEINKMITINKKILAAADKRNFLKHWELNENFHGMYINLSQNHQIRYYINILRQRLFEFTKSEWSVRLTKKNYEEHLKLIDLIQKGRVKKGAEFIRDVHLAFKAAKLSNKNNSHMF